MAKEKEIRKPFNWKKEAKLLPGYVVIILWVIFTFVLLGWVFAASFSTTQDIFAGNAVSSFFKNFPGGLHIENYVKAWTTSNVSEFFMNSLEYSIISCVALILICAPAAYVLARFTFIGNKLIQTSFVSAMGLPVIMIILPLFGLISASGMLNDIISNKIILVLLYIGINVPYTTIFLLTFFASAIYAVSDEFHQLFVEGRAGRWMDVGIDTTGAIVGIGIVTIGIKLSILIKAHMVKRSK